MKMYHPGETTQANFSADFSVRAGGKASAGGRQGSPSLSYVSRNESLPVPGLVLCRDMEVSLPKAECG
jgi:hypothetical protein